VNKIQVKSKEEKIESEKIGDFEDAWIHNIGFLGWFSETK
jgi:hypothetical protein